MSEGHKVHMTVCASLKVMFLFHTMNLSTAAFVCGFVVYHCGQEKKKKKAAVALTTLAHSPAVWRVPDK